MDEKLNIINPEDKEYYDGKFYMVGIYPGAGVELATFYVYASCEEEALELVVAYLDMQPTESNLLYTTDEIEDYISESFADEFQAYMEENPDADTFQFATDYLGYYYIDATMHGASQPYFVEGNNLRVEETNDEPIVFESKEVKTEGLRQDTIDAIDTAINEIDNGNNDDPDWFNERYNNYDKLVQGVLDLMGTNIKYGSGTEKEPTSAVNFSGKDEIIKEVKRQLAEWGYDETYFNGKKEEDCTQAEAIQGPTTIFGDKKKKEEDDTTEKVIWDSWFDFDNEEYKAEIKKNQYQDYLNNLDGEEPEDFEDWYKDYVYSDLMDLEREYLKDDLNIEILPKIEKQVEDDIIVLDDEVFSNSAVEGLSSYIGDFERVRLLTKNNELYIECDGSLSGIYTIPDDETELVQELGYDEDDAVNHFREDLSDGTFDVDTLSEYTDYLKPITYNMNLGESKKEESIQGVANIADKIRQAKAEIEKGNEFDYDGFVSEIKQDTMRLPEKSEQETAATLLQDFCKDYKGRTANKDNQEIERESKEIKTEYYQMPDDEHIIWDSEVDYYDEEYMNDVKENQYQDYLDNFEPSVPMSFEEWLNSEECYDSHYHWFEDSGIEEGDWDGLVELYKAEFQEDYDEYIEDYKDEPLDFDTWYSNYISDSSYEDWEMLEEDLLDNIFPNIDNQVNDSVLVLSGYYGSNYPDFKSSGAGGKLFTDGTKGFRDYMGGFDRVCITTQDGILGAICNDHDGTVSGQFYTLPDDKTELIKALGYEDIIKERYDEEDLDRYDEMDLMETEFNNDLMYEGIDARDLTEHLDLLKPIKDTISGYTPDPEGTKTESKKTEGRYATKEELEEVAKAYCEKMGYTFIFANEDKFGFETKDGQLWTLDYFELADKLKENKEVKIENNKIPRNWKKITYKSKIDTNVDSVGDTIEIERDEWNRPIATNLRTGKTALTFLDMVRNEDLAEVINIETADKETESKKVECKELKTESVSYQDLVIAGESLWRDDARVYETRVEGIYDCQTAGHGGYLVDTDVFPELAKYGEKTPIDNIVGFEEDYEALKVIWAVPEVLEKIQLDKDWYKNLTLDDVLRYEDKLNDEFRKEFPNKKEIAEVPEMKTEAEDMTQVKDDIETAVEKSDSTDLEKDQVKGSLDVLKTDEESAIDGYEEFNKETEKVVDGELADAVKDQMEEIIDDEKEHIEKIDTIKKSLGEFKQIKTESKYVVEYRISDTGEVVKSEPFENFIDAMQYQGNILKKMKDKIDYCKYINVDDDKEVKEEELFGVSDEVKADSKAKGLYTETEDKDFKVGDKVKIDYISDANEYNGQVGTLTMVRKYKYYPNGNADEFEYKTQGTIKFDDGREFNIPDLNREGSGIVSPVDKVEEEMTLVESYDNEKDADVISKALARKGCKTKVECVDNKYQVWSNK